MWRRTKSCLGHIVMTFTKFWKQTVESITEQEIKCTSVKHHTVRMTAEEKLRFVWIDVFTWGTARKVLISSRSAGRLPSSTRTRLFSYSSCVTVNTRLTSSEDPQSSQGSKTSFSKDVSARKQVHFTRQFFITAGEKSCRSEEMVSCDYITWEIFGNHNTNLRNVPRLF